MTLYAPLLLEAVTGDTAISYSAQDFRSVIAALTPNTGVVRATDLQVSQRAAGANLSVDVASGRALIAGGSIANQGTYVAYSDAVTNVSISTPNATNPRIDIIVAQIHDKQADGGTSYGWTLTAIAGTPAVSPAVPATPVSAIKLAEVAVGAAAASIVTANITDRRVLSGTGDSPKFDCNGTPGTPQSVASGSEVAYVPGTISQLVGMVAGPNNGEVTCVTPGRYTVHFSIRLGVSGSACNRACVLALTTSTGTVLRRISNTCFTAGNLPVGAAGTLAITTGQRISARIFQDSGSPLSVDTTNLEANFTVVWLGP